MSEPATITQAQLALPNGQDNLNLECLSGVGV